jgi:hypothetical protein
MMDYETRKPNSHYWALWLVSHNFGPGDKLVTTKSSDHDIVAQASITKAGQKVLLINTQDHPITVNLSGAFSSGTLQAQVVDQKSFEDAPRTDSVSGQQLTLAPFAVAVVSQQK